MRGYTLLELLLVLVLIGVGSAIAVVSIDRLLTRTESMRGFLQVERALHRLRSQAVLGGRTIEATIDFSRNEIRETGSAGGHSVRVTLPESLEIKPVSASARPPPSEQSFFFFPDGTATDVRFMIAEAAGRQRQCHVTGVTGRIACVDA